MMNAFGAGHTPAPGAPASGEDGVIARRETRRNRITSARSLRKGRCHMVGVLLRETEDAHGARLMGSIESVLRVRGFLCITGHHCDQLAMLESYAQEFLRCRVEGMITVDVSFPYEAPLPTVAVKIPESPFVGLYEGSNSTAFRQFVEQLGESAAETLLAQIEYSEPVGPLTVESVGIRGIRV